MRNVDKDKLMSGSHNFYQAARMAIIFAFRQRLLEMELELGTQWKAITDVYYLGHWPISYYENKIFVI